MANHHDLANQAIAQEHGHSRARSNQVRADFRFFDIQGVLTDGYNCVLHGCSYLC
jgi:hypothetical protein